VADDLNSADPVATVPEAAGAPPAEQPKESKWYLWRHHGVALIHYLLDSEVHTFAFSVAANAIISFIPFVVLLYTLALTVFHSQAMVGVVNDMVNYFLPTAAKNKDWMVDHITSEAVLPLLRHQGAQVFSLAMILIACTGIFLPLEVALNQAWGVTKGRNYLFNQVIAFGLAILMAVLALISMFVNVGVQSAVGFLFFQHRDNFIFKTISFSSLAVSTGVASILFLFSVYYLLPNRKVPWRPVLRTSIVTGVIWLLSRSLFALVIPHVDLSIYGPFYISVSLLFWAYISGLIMFAGAQFSVSKLGNKE
jgi:membrane protein